MIQTERLLIRPILHSDTHDRYQYLSDARVFEHFGKGVKTYEEVQASTQWHADQWQQQRTSDLAICHDGTVIGDMILFPKDGGPFELGYVIHPQYWGRGLGFEASHGALIHAFGLTDVVTACTRMTNSASIRILDKLGFSETRQSLGNDGVLRVWYELTKLRFGSLHMSKHEIPLNEDVEAHH